MSQQETKSIIERKKLIELRLENNRIHNYKIQYLPYLDFDPTSFAEPFDVGCRVMILMAVTIAVQQKEHRPAIINWLKAEGVWNHVSPHEIDLFEGNIIDPKSLARFSWQIESAYVLAWVLGLVKELSESCQPMTDDQYTDFITNVPVAGNELKDFLSNLEYIDKYKVIDENLFNELATTYFRDLYFNGSEDDSTINRAVSFERHKALNWTRRFTGIEEWDETDTST